MNAQLIILKITNIKTSQGQMCIAFFENQKQFTTEAPVFTLKIPKSSVRNGSMVVNIPFKHGNYGISVLDDENENGKMNYNLLSIPAEGFGFSNYYHKGILKPSIKDFKFQINNNETKEIYVKLRYID